MAGFVQIGSWVERALIDWIHPALPRPPQVNSTHFHGMRNPERFRCIHYGKHVWYVYLW